MSRLSRAEQKRLDDLEESAAYLHRIEDSSKVLRLRIGQLRRRTRGLNGYLDMAEAEVDSIEKANRGLRRYLQPILEKEQERRKNK